MPKKTSVPGQFDTYAAKKTAKILMHELAALTPPHRYVITIGGESGAGKTRIALRLSDILKKNNIPNILMHQDDYFRHPPRKTHMMRQRDLSVVGTSEVKLRLLDRHLKKLKSLKTSRIKKPVIIFDRNMAKEVTLRCGNAKVIIVEGTYATLLKNADLKVFLAPSYRDTHKGRLARGREKIDRLNSRILAIEHRILAHHRNIADVIIEKNLSLTDNRKAKRRLGRMCILSLHGYVEAKPTLGRTDTGGQVTYILELAKAMSKKGVKVDIYTRKFQKRKNIEQVCKDVRIIRIPCGGDKFIPKERLLAHLNSYVRNMEKFIRKEGLHYDIFHSHYWDAGYVAMKLSEKLGYFFVHTFHSLGAWKRDFMGGNPRVMEKTYRFRERIRNEKALYEKARAFVMTSDDMVRKSRKFYGYRGKNYVIMPAGVNIGVYHPLERRKREKKIDVPANYVFWVGRFASNKGLDYLVKSFADIVTKEKDLFLVIGGGSKQPGSREKKLRGEIRKLIEKRQVTSRVFFTHHIKDKFMASYYRRAKFFVLPSKFEPFGMTAAEAMACGTPVILSKHAGITRHVRNGRDCLIVNPADRKAMTWAFHVLNNNRFLRARLSHNGIKAARKKFSWGHIAEKSIAYYNRLLAEYEF